MWRYLRTHRLLVIQSLVFLFLSLSFIVTNGLYRCDSGICGLWIGKWHLHDALWHISLVTTAFREFPFIHPDFAGANLVGYNYLLDLIIYVFSYIGISPFFVFFQLLPTLTALLFVYLVIRYALESKISAAHANALAFFLFFGSSFSYLMTIYSSGSLYYSSMRGFPVVTSIQPAMMFLNIQFALSLCTILGVMLLIKRELTLKTSLIIGALVFVSLGLKFYAGIMLIGYIGLSMLFYIWDKKKWSMPIVVMGTSMLGFLLAYVSFYRIPGSFSVPFALAPLAITHLMIEDPLLFYNKYLTLARYYIYDHKSGFSPRLFGIEIYSIFLFLLINFGTRLFGLISTLAQVVKKKINLENLTLLILVIISALIPIFFVQEGGWYNTMQFLYYGVFFSGFLAAKPLSDLLSSHKKSYIFLGMMWILLTIPNHFDQLRYLTEKQEVIMDEELAALQFLKEQPVGVVFQSGPTREVGYLPALASQQSYFVDIDQLMVTHVRYEERERSMRHPASVIGDPQIKYVYIRTRDNNAGELLKIIKPRVDYVSIYKNDLVEIFKHLPRP